MPNDKKPKKQKAKAFRITASRDECITLLRALELAKDWTTKNAAPNERSTAAMESADFVVLKERLLTDLVTQGLGQASAPSSP